MVNRPHKKLDVWQESVSLATHIFKITENFPKTEIYGLTSQMRRAVISVPSNIAEGAARSSSKEFIQYLKIAGGSLSELDTQIEIASNLEFITNDQMREINLKMDSISCKLAGLIKHVRTLLSKITPKRESVPYKFSYLDGYFCFFQIRLPLFFFLFQDAVQFSNSCSCMIMTGGGSKG